MTDQTNTAPSTLAPVRRMLESALFQRTIIALIVLNAVILGLETSERAMAAAGPVLIAIDRAILGVFIAEILLKLLVYRLRFFSSGWNLFDALVVSFALMPATGGLQILRALRILRVLRLLSQVPQLRAVVEALLGALPGMGSIAIVLGIIYYVAGVMATQLFGASFPEWFGTLGASVYTLFQVMTLESWSMGIVRPVMDRYPWAWAFFVPYIVTATFCMLNLFIAVIVNSMQRLHDAEVERDKAAAAKDEPTTEERLAALSAQLEDVLAEVRRLRAAQRE